MKIDSIILFNHQWNGSYAESLLFFIMLIACLIMTCSETKAGVVYYHPDHLGSASVLTDELGSISGEIQYYPYGDTFSDMGLSLPHYTYTDQESDRETSLSYYGARYLDTELGKFLSPDPLSDITYPQDLNPYQYARGNPLVYIDPDGKEEVKVYSTMFKALREARKTGSVQGFILNPPYRIVSTSRFVDNIYEIKMENPQGEKISHFFNKTGGVSSGPRLSHRERYLVQSMKIANDILRRAEHYGEFQKHVDISMTYIDKDGLELPIDSEDTSLNNRMVHGFKARILRLPFSDEERFLFDQKPEVLEEIDISIEPILYLDTKNHTPDEFETMMNETSVAFPE